jgi:hypothetical protein
MNAWTSMVWHRGREPGQDRTVISGGFAARRHDSPFATPVRLIDQRGDPVLAFPPAATFEESVSGVSTWDRRSPASTSSRRIGPDPSFPRAMQFLLWVHTGDSAKAVRLRGGRTSVRVVVAVRRRAGA